MAGARPASRRDFSPNDGRAGAARDCELLVDDATTEANVRARCVFPGAENIRSYQIPTVDSWIRDYGPNFLVSDKLQFVAESPEKILAKTNDKLKFVGHSLAYNDWIFNAWGNKYEELKQDDSIPRAFGELAERATV